MFLVIEGGIAVGKSNLARSLGEHLKLPVYRPFRRPGDGHDPGRWMSATLRGIIPVNTWMEDIFVADAVAGLKASGIADRSLPSALAYNEMRQDPGGFPCLSAAERAEVFGLWASTFKRGDGILLHLTCDVEERRRRIVLSPLDQASHQMSLTGERLTEEARLIAEYCERLGWSEGAQAYHFDTTNLTKLQTLSVVVETVGL